MSKRARRLAAIAVMLLVAASCRQATDTVGTAEPGEIRTGVGVEGKTIKVGELAALTGTIAVIGKPLLRGHEVYFTYVNEVLGGVGKDLPEDERFKIELVTRDGQYLPEVHVQEYNALKDEVLVLAQSIGTPTTKAILPQIREDKILTGAATLSAEWLAEKYAVPAGAPYPVQFINAADYMMKNSDGTPKVGIIFQDDDYGAEGVRGLEHAAKELDFEIVVRASYKPTDQEFTAQVQQMKNAGATHVFLTAIPSATGKILGTAATLDYTPRFIGQSPTWITAFKATPGVTEFMEDHFWWVTDASCQWGDTSDGCEGMKELLDNTQKYASDQEPDVFYLFGYTQARIIHQILEKAIELGDLTREGVVTAFESLENVDMGGLLNPISYGTECEDKVPATATGIFEVVPSEPLGLKQIESVDSPAVKTFDFCPAGGEDG